MADDLIAFNDRMTGHIRDRQPVYSEAVAAIGPMLTDIDSLLIQNRTLTVRVAALTAEREIARGALEAIRDMFQVTHRSVGIPSDRWLSDPYRVACAVLEATMGEGT